MKAHKKTLIVGLTGQTGGGKSTVGKLFADRGAVVLDADTIARHTIEGSTQCLADLVLEYSTEIITPQGTLNRKKLASICFSDKEKLKRLNEITYPHIIHDIEEKIDEICISDPQYLILDAPTLYEAGLDQRCDAVVAVLADEETRALRIIARDQMTDEEARTRIHAQKKDSFYTERADYVLYNNGDMDALHLAFIEVCGKLETLWYEKSGVPVPQKISEKPEEDEDTESVPVKTTSAQEKE